MNIGSLFNRNKEFDIDKEIKTLYDELRTIGELKQMKETEGWQRLSAMLNARITKLKTKSDSLLSNATKNGKEIEKINCAYSIYQQILDEPEIALNEEKSIGIKLKQLTEIAKSRELASAR